MGVRRAVVPATVVVAVAVVGLVLRGGAPTPSAAGCPPGYTQEADGGAGCVSLQHPEKPIELILREAGARSPRSAPYASVHPDAYASALEQRKALAANPPNVKGVAGAWKLVGHGPLESDGADYTNVNGLGLHDLSARLDSLAYDAANNRLFAAEGTGGVWMSTDGGGTWRSIGDTLPRARMEASDAVGNGVGAFEPRGGLRRGGAVLWAGRELELRPASRWRERYALADGDREIALFDGKGWGKRPVRVTVADADGVDPGLLLFAAFVVRGLAEDGGAAAAASAG